MKDLIKRYLDQGMSRRNSSPKARQHEHRRREGDGAKPAPAAAGQTAPAASTAAAAIREVEGTAAGCSSSN